MRIFILDFIRSFGKTYLKYSRIISINSSLKVTSEKTASTLTCLLNKWKHFIETITNFINTPSRSCETLTLVSGLSCLTLYLMIYWDWGPDRVLGKLASQSKVLRLPYRMMHVDGVHHLQRSLYHGIAVLCLKSI